MTKAIIVAIADNYAIGKGNALLWHLGEDLKYFKRVTSGHPVIMGYMTYKSIGRPLPGRLNIVSTWYPFDAPEGVSVVYSLSEAYAVAEKHFDLMETPEDERLVFVIGGGETYRNALPGADLLYITHVHTNVEDADTYFPVIDPRIWEKVSSEAPATDPESGLTYEFTVYKRTNLWKEKNSDPGSPS